MNIINFIELEDVGPFKQKVKFEIPKGLTAIYGLNRAGGPSSKNSNGVGKSFLMSVLPEIVYDEPIVGEKSDRIMSGRRETEFISHHGKKIRILRQAKGKSEKITVFENDVDLELRTLPIARKYIQKEWPITADDYNTFVHIDSRIPHPLVMGNTTIRKDFFTKFFNLDKLDTERKLYNSALNELKKVRAAYGELRAQYLKSKRDLLEPERLEKLQQSLRVLRKKLKTLQTEYATVQETIRLVSYGKSAREQILTLEKACGGEITEEEFAKTKEDNKWELQKIEKDLEDAEAWEQYRRDNKAYIEAANKLSDEANKLIEAEGLKAARASSAEAARNLIRARESVKRIKADIEGIDMPDLPKRCEAPAEDAEELRTLKRVYEHHLEHAEKFEDGKCETCGQPVKIKDPKIVQKKLDSILEKLKAHKAAAEYAEAKKERTQLEFKLRAYEKDLVRAREKVESLKADAAVANELRDLPRKPRPFTGKKLQVVVLKKMLEELNERKALLRYLEPHLDTVIAFAKLTVGDVEKAEASEGLSDRMSEIQEKLSSYQAKLEVHETVKSRVDEMRTRLREMKAQLEEEEPLKILVQGYQDKNIKKMAIEAISSRLMPLVNKYAAAIFPESYQFEFIWDSQINIVVHRKYGKRTLSSDVRKLSGAESTLFTLVLVCALLNFVPSHKRMSVMILDEPSARLSKEMTERLQVILQTLNTMIPSIVVVTPKDEIYEGATNFTVVKSRDGSSRLVKKGPWEIGAND